MEYVEDEFCNKSLVVDVINCTIQYNKHVEEETELTPEAVAVPMTFSLILLVGLTGNILLIWNFASYKKLSTPHNALVVNLAVGDLLMLCFGVPFNSVWYTLPSWPFGDFVCRLSRFVETYATVVTIATLAILSIERYYIVTGRRRHHHHQLSSVPKLVIVAIWGVGLIPAVPDFASSGVVTIPIHAANATHDTNVTANTTRTETESAEFCLDFNPEWGKEYAKSNIMFKFLLYFCIPLLIIAPFYILLAFHLFYKMFGSRGAPTSKTPLRSSAATNPVRREPLDDTKNDGPDDPDHPEQEPKADSSPGDAVNLILSNSVSNGRGRERPLRKRQRLAVTVLGLVLCFLLCWLPRYVYLLWFHFNPEPYNAFWHVFKITGFCLMFSNSAINPFVFYVLDLHFRDFVHAALTCRLSQSDQRRGGRGGRGGGGGGENGAVDTTMSEADRKMCVVMQQMPGCSDRADAV